MRNILTKPWSFIWGGFLVGLAEVLYFLEYETPIPITTGLAKMFATLEENITKTDFIARTYSADIHWVVIGIIVGGCSVALIERERKTWVRYPLRVSVLAFIGGIIFGFGTRLAQGCTTWHYLGGIYPQHEPNLYRCSNCKYPFCISCLYVDGKNECRGIHETS